MSKDTPSDTRQARMSRFRFSIIGPLLSAPPKKGELKSLLEALSKKTWQHPITGQPITLSFSTLEHWFYLARKTHDPVGALRTKRRTDAASTRKMSAGLKRVIQGQYQNHPRWSYQLHVDNLKVHVKENPELASTPTKNDPFSPIKIGPLTAQEYSSFHPSFS